MIRRLLLFVFIPASLAFAQLDSNSVIVTTTSNSSTLQPDQVLFIVNVNAPLTSSLNNVLAALAGSGITQANLSGSSNQAYFPVGAVTNNPFTGPSTSPCPGLK